MYSIYYYLLGTYYKYNNLCQCIDGGLPSFDKQFVHSTFDTSLLWSASHERINVLEHLLGLTTLRISLFSSLYSILVRLSFLSVSKVLNFHSKARLSNVVGSNRERSPTMYRNIVKHISTILYL